MLVDLLKFLMKHLLATSAKDVPQEARMPVKSIYDPRIFDAADLESAKFVILTPTPDMTTNERWEAETRNLVGLLGRIMPLDGNSCVLDYGCGIGRLAKGLIDRYGCRVVGVDISARMREFAREYVQSDRFVVC